MPTKKKKIVIPNSARDTIRRRVRKGAATLDASKPKWRNKVQPEHLCMESGLSCILGQVYGGYWKGVQKLCGVDNGEAASRHNGFNLGFHFDDEVVQALVTANVPETATKRARARARAEEDMRNAAWDVLHNAWVKELAKV